MLNFLAKLQQLNEVFLVLGSILSVGGLAMILYRKITGSSNTAKTSKKHSESMSNTHDEISSAHRLFEQMKPE